MSVGAKIEALRIKAGRTRRDLAAVVGITENWLFKIERGNHTPSFEIVIKIAEALNISLDQLRP
jgi:transcriptional regulator with XRE-family HTH domain